MFRKAIRFACGVAALLVLANCASPSFGPRQAWPVAPGCDGAARAAARANAGGLDGPAINLFGRPELGWAIYAPLVEETVATRCAADTPGFAVAVGRWQASHGLAPSGVLDPATLAAMKARWQAARPFLAVRARGICPDPPPSDALETAAPTETLGGKPIQLRRGALAAYRRMVAAAREAGAIPATDPALLALMSGYRDPAADAARCAAENNCNGIVRAACSAHRTGLAVDLNLGAAPGASADSTADANRLFQTRTLAYRWLVSNAGRFGFVNYAFEPWHWEWTGEAP